MKQLSDVKGLSVIGKIAITRTNKKTGERFQHTQHNVVTTQMSLYFMGALSCGGYSHQGAFRYLDCGDGSNEPTGGDTAMSHRIWGDIGISSVPRIQLAGNRTAVEVTYRFIIPATGTYVGSLRELGLRVSESSYSNSKLVTHALLKDAEDNPITIEKTDLEQLDIDYTLAFIFSEPAAGVFSSFWPYWVYANAVKGTPTTVCPRFNMNTAYENGQFSYGLCLCSPKVKEILVGTARVFYFGYPFVSNTGNQYNRTQDTANLRNVYYNNRIRAEQGNVHYIHGTALGNAYQLRASFPDATLMNPVTLADMPVGVGDGATTEFKPPLNFWMADTETLYADGTPLVRNVDYTCDPFNNLDDLEELYPTSHAITIAGKILSTSISNAGISNKLYRASEYASLRTSHLIGAIPNTPQIIELPLEEDSERDYSIDSWYILREINTNISSVTVSYSNDGETWTQWGILSSITTSFQKLSGPLVTAKYWKFEVAAASWPSSYSTSLRLYARRTGAKIIFTNPPADGVVITMSAQIDRPLKNDKHVLDWNPTVQF